MKHINIFITGLVATLMLASCNPDAKYFSENVKLNIEITAYSAGYSYVSFKTSRPAYYMCGIENITNKDIVDHPSQYMTLAVDSLYLDYLQWRHEYLKEGEDHIADFQSHSLKYGNAVQTFFPLDEDTEYWLYAFVVDPDTKQPVGQLVKTRFRTKKSDELDMHCNIRVDDTWLYSYPTNSNGKINDICPYYWAILNEEDFNREYSGNVDVFILAVLGTYKIEDWLYVSSFGVDVMNDNFDFFKAGVNYHFISFSMDGKFDNVVHYKFQYEGPNTKLEQKHPDDNLYVVNKK